MAAVCQKKLINFGQGVIRNRPKAEDFLLREYGRDEPANLVAGSLEVDAVLILGGEGDAKFEELDERI